MDEKIPNKEIVNTDNPPDEKSEKINSEEENFATKKSTEIDGGEGSDLQEEGDGDEKLDGEQAIDDPTQESDRKKKKKKKKAKKDEDYIDYGHGLSEAFLKKLDEWRAQPEREAKLLDEDDFGSAAESEMENAIQDEQIDYVSDEDVMDEEWNGEEKIVHVQRHCKQEIELVKEILARQLLDDLHSGKSDVSDSILVSGAGSPQFDGTYIRGGSDNKSVYNEKPIYFKEPYQ
ncbi:hypothetical protein AAMO2058_001706300, partial [Amorphochlora amoebiformis]